MSDNSAELDSLMENDILKALGEEEVVPDLDAILGDSKTTNFEGLDDMLGSIEDDSKKIQKDENIDITNSCVEESKKLDLNLDANSLTSLLSELLNNKTLEITIKVKD